uniref:Uncharacterized protein n=1 Tax=Zea mays TaxID=4577 RepID=A0A804M1R3_MAIZE
MSAPRSIRSRTVSARPLKAARMSGVHPCASRPSTDAPPSAARLTDLTSPLRAAARMASPSPKKSRIRPPWPSSAAISNAVFPATSRTEAVPETPCDRRRRATASSPRLAAAWSAVAPSAPHLASALAPAARSALTASRRPASAANRRGVLPSLPAASIDVKEDEKDEDEAGEAEAGLARSSLRTSLWPAAAATWMASEPAGVAPLARRSSAMRHSPAAAAVSRGVRPRLGLSASAPYSSSTWTMSARARPTARSSSVRPDSSVASAARHSGSLRSSTSLSASTAPASTSRAATDAPTKLALIPLSTNTCLLLAENHSGLTESSAVTGSFTAAPGATTLCSRNASSPRLPEPLGPSGGAEARYSTSTVTAASGARIPVCGRTAKRPRTAGCSLNATGMVCIAFRSVSSPLACLPGSTRTTTSFDGSDPELEEAAIKRSGRRDGVLWLWPARRGGVPHGGCEEQGGLVLCGGSSGVFYWRGGQRRSTAVAASGGNFPVASPVAVARHCRRY